MSKLSTDRRGVTSLEYALVAATLALVLIAVLRVPVLDLMEVFKHLMASLHGHTPTI